MDRCHTWAQVRFILQFHQCSINRVSNLHSLHADLEFCSTPVLGHGEDEIQRAREKSRQSTENSHIGCDSFSGAYSAFAPRLLCSTVHYCDCSDGIDDPVSLVWSAGVLVLGVVFHFHNVRIASV